MEQPKYKVGSDVYTVLDYPLPISRVAKDFGVLANVNYGVVKGRIMSVINSETIPMKEGADLIVSTQYVVVPVDKKGNPIPNMQKPDEPLMLRLNQDDIFESANEVKVAFLKLIDQACENFRKRTNDSATDAVGAAIELVK